jgi:hypothetical protein
MGSVRRIVSEQVGCVALAICQCRSACHVSSNEREHDSALAIASGTLQYQPEFHLGRYAELCNNSRLGVLSHPFEYVEMSKRKWRPDVVLILIGASLAGISFGINWMISSQIDRQRFEVVEQLHDIDRFLNFSDSSTLQAMELNSSARTDIAISQLMYFQILQDKPNQIALDIYNSLIQNAANNLASAVTCAHTAGTGKTMQSAAAEQVMQLATAQDLTQTTPKLSLLLQKKLKRSRDIRSEKVMTRRTLIVLKSQLESRQSLVGKFSRLLQLLGILIVLAKDVITAKKPDDGDSEELVAEDTRLAA